MSVSPSIRPSVPKLLKSMNRSTRSTRSKNDSPWQSITVLDSQWQSLTVHDSPWQSMTVLDSPWQFMTVLDSPWQSMTVHNSPWQSMIVHVSQVLTVSHFWLAFFVNHIHRFTYLVHFLQGPVFFLCFVCSLYVQLSLVKHGQSKDSFKILRISDFQNHP